MVNIKGEKVFICGLADVLSAQIAKRLGSQIRKVSQLRKARKSNKLF
jgi:hypothetical protein